MTLKCTEIKPSPLRNSESIRNISRILPDICKGGFHFLLLQLFLVFLTVPFAGCMTTEMTVIETLSNVSEPEIRVLLFETKNEISLIPHAKWEITVVQSRLKKEGNPDAEIAILLQKGAVSAATSEFVIEGEVLFFAADIPNGIFTIENKDSNVPWDKRSFEGRLEILVDRESSLAVVLVLPVEEYLRGVVPSEIGASSPMAAIYAQAVAARSEAFVALKTGKYAGEYHDLCSTTMSQVFSGVERRSSQTDEAVRNTRGIVMMFDEKPVSAYYFSNCGGHTENICNVWSERGEEKSYWDTGRFDGEETAVFGLDLRTEEDFLIWLESSPQSYCNPEYYTLPEWTHKNYRWEREVNAEQLSLRVARIKNIGRITAIRPLRRGVSGRLIEVEFVGEKGTLQVGPELVIRRMFSPLLQSAAFIVDVQDISERPEKFIIRGAGSGHGVGMCQVGAMGMANAGKTYREILQHYYPHVTLKKMY